jgi:hypothetical protein
MELMTQSVSGSDERFERLVGTLRRDLGVG